MLARCLVEIELFRFVCFLFCFSTFVTFVRNFLRIFDFPAALRVLFVLAVALAINAGDRLTRSGPGTPNTADRIDSHGERRRTELWQTHTR